MLHTNYKYAKTMNMYLQYLQCTVHAQIHKTTQQLTTQNVNKFVLLSLHKNAFENFESRISDLVYDDMS